MFSRVSSYHQSTAKPCITHELLLKRLCHCMTSRGCMAPSSLRMPWLTSSLQSTIQGFRGVPCVRAQQTHSFPSKASQFIIISNSQAAKVKRSSTLSTFGQNKRMHVVGSSQCTSTLPLFRAVDKVISVFMKI
jgi:hypothetical protein